MVSHCIVVIFMMLNLGSCKSRDEGKISSRESTPSIDASVDPSVEGFFEAAKSFPLDGDRIATLLGKLPPGFLQSYTLAYAPRGLQEGDSTNPRAIVFAHDGSLIFSFNGSEKHSEHNAIEMMRFNRSIGEFELFELSLVPNQQAQLHGPNPSTCLACHGQQPRPIWPNYPNWRGIYGSDDDFLTNKKVDGQINSEIEMFNKEYLPNAATHPRYSKLARPVGYPRFPYSTGGKGSLTFRPNARLGIILKSQNTERWIAKARRSQDYNKIIGPLISEILNCKAVDEYAGLPTATLNAVKAYMTSKGIKPLVGGNRINIFINPPKWEYFSDYLTILGIPESEFHLEQSDYSGDYSEGLGIHHSILRLVTELSIELGGNENIERTLVGDFVPETIEPPFEGFKAFYDQKLGAKLKVELICSRAKAKSIAEFGR